MCEEEVTVQQHLFCSNPSLSHIARHRYSQYLTAEVIDSNGRPIKDTNSSFYHCLRCLEWVPAYRPLEGGKSDKKYLCPNSVYLPSEEVTSLLGTHVHYIDSTDVDLSDFSQALGKDWSLMVI